MDSKQATGRENESGNGENGKTGISEFAADGTQLTSKKTVQFTAKEDDDEDNLFAAEDVQNPEKGDGERMNMAAVAASAVSSGAPSSMSERGEGKPETRSRPHHRRQASSADVRKPNRVRTIVGAADKMARPRTLLSKFRDDVLRMNPETSAPFVDLNRDTSEFQSQPYQSQESDGAQQQQQPPPVAKQYRIRSNQDADGSSGLGYVVPNFDPTTFWGGLAQLTSEGVSEYLRWTFRASFFESLGISFLFFIIFILFFAGVIHLIDEHQPGCVAGVDKLTYMDAFQLSWTTLSTVGYGLISPNTLPETSSCLLINFLMAFESFVGVMFSAVTGSIIFAKIVKIQSVAHVRFSDPICIRYGSGLLANTDSQPVTREGTSQLSQDEYIHGDDDEEWPCPIMEFRVINTDSGVQGGEIMDATISLVAAKLELAESSIQVGKKKRSKTYRHSYHGSSIIEVQAGRGANLLRTDRLTGSGAGGAVQKLSETIRNMHANADKLFDEKVVEQQIENALEEKLVQTLEQQIKMNDNDPRRLSNIIMNELKDGRREQGPIAVDEGNSDLSPRRVFQKLHVHTDTHPYFRRVWFVRHSLDVTSPLLKNRVRQMLKENGGRWPKEMCTHEFIRKSLQFQDVIVSFSGIARGSRRTVYAQKVYKFVDINIGYTFAPMMYRAFENGPVQLDMDLLNDVREQRGGGGEPLKRFVTE